MIPPARLRRLFPPPLLTICHITHAPHRSVHVVSSHIVTVCKQPCAENEKHTRSLGRIGRNNYFCIR